MEKKRFRFSEAPKNAAHENPNHRMGQAGLEESPVDDSSEMVHVLFVSGMAWT